MRVNRRHLVAAAALAAGGAAAAPASAQGRDTGASGLTPDSPMDQSAAMQRAVDRAARMRETLSLPPGRYRVAGIRLPAHARLSGVPGATQLELARNTPLFTAEGAAHVALDGLQLDGMTRKPPEGQALVHLVNCTGLAIRDCEILRAGRNAITLERCGGAVESCTIEDCGDGAVFAIDSTGLRIAANTIRRAGNNGIQVWRNAFGDDGTIVSENRITDTRADAGGDGPYGNAISVYRAGNVIVRGNRIDGAAFSAVRGNSASNIQISGNTCTRLGEVAIYSEFAFEGASISGNIVDGATVGISVTNFDHGGRLAVVQGNLLRNLGPAAPGKGIGIAIAADTVVSGNVIEKAPTIGIGIGYGPYLRDVVVSANILRETGIGVAVSVVEGSGTALVADNLIAGATGGAVVGMEWEKRVTGDMTRDGTGRFAQVVLNGNRIR